jgi:hypothetical protein
MNPKLEFGVLRVLSATNDSIPLIAPKMSAFQDLRFWETNTRTRCISPFSNFVNVYHTICVQSPVLPGIPNSRGWASSGFEIDVPYELDQYVI